MAGNILDDVKAQEAKLGLPDGFYSDLLNQDDWSFVIKLNALIEAACTHSLVSRLRAPVLADSLASLDLGNQKFGKVALLRKLGSITSDQSSILQMLYELRNYLAHNINQVSFSFARHLGSLDDTQRANFIKRAGHGVKETIVSSDSLIPRSEFVLQNPKLALWITVAEIIACLYLDHDLVQAKLGP